MTCIEDCAGQSSRVNSRSDFSGEGKLTVYSRDGLLQRHPWMFWKSFSPTRACLDLSTSTPPTLTKITLWGVGVFKDKYYCSPREVSLLWISVEYVCISWQPMEWEHGGFGDPSRKIGRHLQW
jgi:hypothetical protein